MKNKSINIFYLKHSDKNNQLILFVREHRLISMSKQSIDLIPDRKRITISILRKNILHKGLKAIESNSIIMLQIVPRTQPGTET